MVGVEEEFLLLDPDTGRVRPAAPLIMPSAPVDAQQEITREQIEVGTPPLISLAELRASLLRLRRATAAAARSAGVAIAALATSPLPATPTTTGDERYRQIVRRYARTGREQLTCGCHVHVSVRSRAEAVGVLDRIRPWLGCLIAISANSPFWQGEDTGYASWRTQLWQRWPSAGPTELFGSVKAYDDLANALTASGTILDRKMLYFDARPSEHLPTIEVRVADVCLSVDNAVLVAGLVRALVATAAGEWARGVPPVPARSELLRMAQWQASKSALEGDLVDVVNRQPVPAEMLLAELTRHVKVELDRAGDTTLVAAGLRRLLREGTAAVRQRAAYARRGDLVDVVRDAIEATVAG